MADIPLNIGGNGFGNALAQGFAVRNANLRGELEQESLNTLRRRNALGPDVQAAIKGDAGALGRVAAVDPDYALKLGPIMETMDAKNRAKLQAGADFAYKAANSILQADPAERPLIWRQMITQGGALGHDMSKLPPEYTPQMDGYLRSMRQMAIPVLDQWKVEQDRPQPMGPAGVSGAAISNIESGGRYDAVGPVATAQGNRAYGKYQVLDSNIGPWTQEVVGKAMSPQEFLADSKAQDAVFAAKFGQYTQKYGPQGAARAWFAGEGGMNNPGASDVNGMTVANYERKFSAGLPGQAAPGVPGPVAAPPVAQGDTQRADGSGTPLPPTAPMPKDLQQFVPQGWRMLGIKGQPAYDHAGRLLVQKPDGSTSSIEIPKTPQPTFGWQDNGGSLAPVPGGPNDPETIRREAEARRKAEAGTPFTGNSMDAQAYNIVLGGDPSSPEYAAAYAHLAAPRVQVDPTTGQAVQIKPDMSWARPPAGGVGAKGIEAQAIPGIKRTPEAFKKLEVEVGSLNSAIERFRKVIGESGGSAFSAFINNPQDPAAQTILGAFNAMKTALRSEAFVNTGVLQPAEMKMLDDMLLAPTSVRGLFAKPESYGAMLDEIQQYVGNKMQAARAAYGVEGTAAGAAPAPAGNIPTVNSPEEAAKLPRGTQFRTPDGRLKVVP